MHSARFVLTLRLRKPDLRFVVLTWETGLVENKKSTDATAEDADPNSAMQTSHHFTYVNLSAVLEDKAVATSKGSDLSRAMQYTPIPGRDALGAAFVTSLTPVNRRLETKRFQSGRGQSVKEVIVAASGGGISPISHIAGAIPGGSLSARHAANRSPERGYVTSGGCRIKSNLPHLVRGFVDNPMHRSEQRASLKAMHLLTSVAVKRWERVLIHRVAI